MKYALLIGANSGLGFECLKALIGQNFHVFALDINVDKLLNIEGVTAYKVDITKQEDIDDAKTKIEKITDKISVVANFAGIVLLGSLVEKDAKLIEKIFDINLFGMYRINKTFFPFVKNAQGRIINISSEYGKITALPFHSFYTSVKHAIEVYSAGLRRELQFFNIPVVTIRPGAFRTAMQQNIDAQFDSLVNETNYYKKPLTKMKNIMTTELKKAKDPEKFVRFFVKAAISKKPRNYYNVCNSKKMKLLSIIPSKLTDKILKSYFK